MTLDVSHRYRITVWPTVPVPFPSFTRHTTHRLDESGRALVADGYAVGVAERVGGIYLVLRGLDLESPMEILEFARAFGFVSDWQVAITLKGAYLPSPYRFQARQPPSSDRAWLDEVIAGDAELRDRYSQDGQQASLVPTVVSLESFRHAAKFVRDLTTAWQIVSQDEHLEPDARWELHPDLPPPTRHEALQLLGESINTLLARLHPHINVSEEPPDDYDPNDPIGPADIVPPDAPLAIEQATPSRGWILLHQICALELYNDIINGEVYRRCHNETCGKLFVRQWGRASYGQSRRKGVMYCTASCATAQSQRVYRRRKHAVADRPKKQARRRARPSDADL